MEQHSKCNSRPMHKFNRKFGVIEKGEKKKKSEKKKQEWRERLT